MIIVYLMPSYKYLFSKIILIKYKYVVHINQKTVVHRINLNQDSILFNNNHLTKIY